MKCRYREVRRRCSEAPQVRGSPVEVAQIEGQVFLRTGPRIKIRIKIRPAGCAARMCVPRKPSLRSSPAASRRHRWPVCTDGEESFTRSCRSERRGGDFPALLPVWSDVLATGGHFQGNTLTHRKTTGICLTSVMISGMAGRVEQVTHPFDASFGPRAPAVPALQDCPGAQVGGVGRRAPQWAQGL